MSLVSTVGEVCRTGAFGFSERNDLSLGGAKSRRLSISSWFQSAMKIWDFLSLVLLLVQESVLPSGEKQGNPSKPSDSVTLMGCFSPFMSTAYNSKLLKPWRLVEKIRYLLDGWKKGAHDIASRVVSFFSFLELRSIR